MSRLHKHSACETYKKRGIKMNAKEHAWHIADMVEFSLGMAIGMLIAERMLI